MCLATMVYVYAARAVCVTVYTGSTGYKFRPVSNFTKLHAFTALLVLMCFCLFEDTKRVIKLLLLTRPVAVLKVC